MIIANHYLIGRDLQIPTSLLAGGIKGEPNERSSLFYHSHAPLLFGLQEVLQPLKFKALGWNAGFDLAAKESGILYLDPHQRVQRIRAIAREDSSLLYFPEGRARFGSEHNFGIDRRLFTIARLMQAEALLVLALPDFVSTKDVNRAAVCGAVDLRGCQHSSPQVREVVANRIARILTLTKLDLER